MEGLSRGIYSYKDIIRKKKGIPLGIPKGIKEL